MKKNLQGINKHHCHFTQNQNFKSFVTSEYYMTAFFFCPLPFCAPSSKNSKKARKQAFFIQSDILVNFSKKTRLRESSRLFYLLIKFLTFLIIFLIFIRLFISFIIISFIIIFLILLIYYIINIIFISCAISIFII